MSHETRDVEYVLFYGGPFSQWAESPFILHDETYNCAEQYMMAQKAHLFDDLDAWEAIMATPNPAEQKAIGRQVRGFNVVVWEAVARDIVLAGSLAKFTQNHGLREQLLATRGKLLVEASPTDRIWGIGLSEDDPRAHDPGRWRGRNWLGQVLTDLRVMLTGDFW